MHIGICGPIATADVAHLFERNDVALPCGYAGAPLLGTLIKELLRRGHQVSAFTLSSDLPLTRDGTVVLRGPSFELHCCPMRPKAWPFNGALPGRIVDLYAFERRGLEQAITSAKPDVVHAHWSYEFAWAALRSGLPHVITCHDSPFVIARFQRDLRHGGYRWLRAFMAWHVLRQARQVTTVSPYMLNQIQPLCRTPVAVVPNPIASPPFATPRPARSRRQTVLMVANGWDVRKNAQSALRAFAILTKRLPSVELRLFGQEFGEGQAAQNWWRQSGLSGEVLFFGSVTHERLLQEMSQANVFVHTALEESFGAVLAEALACGVPVVGGSSSGAVPWVVGNAGLLVDITQPDLVAKALLELLSHPEEASRLGRLGSERVKTSFSAAVVATAYEHEYAKAMACEVNSVGAQA